MNSSPTRARWSMQRLVRTPAAALVLAAALLAACSGEGCDCEGFQQQDFPDEHNDKTVPRSGQVRLTDTGVAFLEQQVPNILREALPDGLSFCIPETESGDADVCHTDNSTCDDGSTGCQLNLSIDEVSIETAPQDDELLVDVTVGMLDETIPFDYSVWGITAECEANLHESGAQDMPGSIDATVPIRFQVDQQSPTRDVSFEVGEVSPDMSNLGIDIDGRGGFGNTAACETADGVVKPLARDEIENQLTDELNAVIQSTIREQRCRPCGDGQAACPADSSCREYDDARYCDWDADDRDGCVRKPLGIEGRLALHTLLGEYMQPDAANIDLMARAADTADVTDGGLNLGIRAGFQQDQLRDCSPASDESRPSLSPIEPSSAIYTNLQPGLEEPFMVGIGIHKNAVEQLAWTAWAGGATCLEVGTSVSEMLTTGSLELFLPSLERLADRDGPVFLKVVPQTAPTVELGPNTITETDDDYELDEPLLTLNWQDLDLHFYAFVQDRFVRLYTTRLDVELPVGVTTDGMGSLVPVVGDLREAPENVRVRNRGLLAEDEETLRDVLPQLLNAVIPQVTGSLQEPIELPEFFGYRIAVEQDQITAADNDQFIALYADLKYTGSSQPMSGRLEPRVLETNVDVSPRNEAGIREPVVEMQLGARTLGGVAAGAPNAYEYSYRVDNGFWSMYSKRSTLRIDSPILSFPGEHRIQVRARRAGEPGTAGPPIETTVEVDYQPPELEIERDDSTLVLEGDDLVDSADELQYRHRLETPDGEPHSDWSSWSDEQTVDLSALEVEGPVRIVAQVRDTSGYVGESAETVELRPHEESIERIDDAERSSPHGDPQPAVGCAVAPNSRDAPAGALLFALVGLLGVALRRRRSTWLFAALFAVLALAGCSNDIAQEDNQPGPDAGSQQQCDPACEDWQSCEAGTCVADGCENPSDCDGEATCIDGTCAEPECESDSECSCEDGAEGTCMNGACTCREFCADGCSEDEYCCYAEDTCKSLPDPCQGHSCDPGHEPSVASPATPDREACTVEEGSCECVEKDPLDLRWYGQYASTATNGEVTAVSAYNRFYGDLMVGTIDEDLEPTWYFPAGVPSDGEIVAAPSGPRGGTEARGDDLGTHTALAVDDSDRLHVFFRSEETDALHYARGTAGEDGYTFESAEIDAASDLGYYTDATVVDGVVHAVYTAPEAEVEIDGETMTGSQIRHVSFPTDTGLEQIAPEPEVVHEIGPPSPCNGCASGEACLESAAECRETTGDCDGNCEDAQACIDAECRNVYQKPAEPGHRLSTGLYNRLVATPDGLLVVFYDRVARTVGRVAGTTGDWGEPTHLESPSGPYADVAIDADGDRHLAYMDPETHSLLYRAPDADQPEVVADGLRDGPEEYIKSAIGEDVRLWLTDEGTPQVVFQDATDHLLVQAERSGSDSWSTTELSDPGAIENYDGARGFYAASPAPEAGLVVEHVIDQQAEPAGARLEIRALE